MFKNQKLLICLPLLILFFLNSSCTPKFVPADLKLLKTPEALGRASAEAYQKSKSASDKKEILKWSHAGILYSERCLKLDPKQVLCLYYNVLNQGAYIRHHLVNYQTALKKMIHHCEQLIEIDPAYEHAGCYRVLGNIFAKAPSFSLDPKNITKDLDKSSEYLQEAVKLSPGYALNHLFLARTLQELGEDQGAIDQLAEFDRLSGPNLDKEYPRWKKERAELAQKLGGNHGKHQ